MSLIEIQAGMETIGDRIRKARRHKKLTQDAIAKHFGISRVSVTQWEGNITKPEADKFVGLAKLLGGDADWFLAGVGASPWSIADSANSSSVHIPNAVIHRKVTEAVSGTLPVYGQAVGGLDGEFMLNGSHLYDTMAPPSLSRENGAYAVRVSGDSMSPRYEDGELAYVDPKRFPRRGDYVVAQVKYQDDGTDGSTIAFVKRFIRRNSDELVLEQFNPAKELRFEAEHVVSVHCIVMAGVE